MVSPVGEKNISEELRSILEKYWPDRLTFSHLASPPSYDRLRSFGFCLCRDSVCVVAIKK